MKSKYRIHILIALLVIVAVLCIYMIVYQSYHQYGIAIASLCVLLLFLSILSLQYLLINTVPGSFWTYNIRALTVILLMFPFVYLLIKYENKYEERELKSHGIIASVVVSSTYVNRSKGRLTYFAVYQYTVNGQAYTHKIGNRNDIYKRGDSVKIIYSAEHPNINKIIGYEKIKD